MSAQKKWFLLSLTLFVIVLIIKVIRPSKAAALKKEEIHSLTNQKLSDTLIDVGNKQKLSSIETDFWIYNEGPNLLYIENLEPDCHCTVASYQKTGINVNDSSKITLRYDSTRIGVFQSSVLLTTNSTNSPTILVFRGNVIDSLQIH